MVDVSLIKVSAGNGGDGSASFRREKYVARGGPDGGDGGDGGDVYLVGEKNLRTLDYFASRERFVAQSGERGRKQKQTGKDGEDLYLKVPLGTVVWHFDVKDDADVDKKKLFELLRVVKDRFDSFGLEALRSDAAVVREESGNLGSDEQVDLVGEVVEHGGEVKVAKGGQGGRGNDAFKSATNQTPREFENGERGEVKWLVLELKLLADVGLVGLPNAGKSTLLSVLTSARPKVAEYPFTTLEPNLGVMSSYGFASSRRLPIRPFRDSNPSEDDRHGEILRQSGISHHTRSAQDDKPSVKSLVGLSNASELVIADIPGLIEGASRGKGLGDEFLRHVERTKTLVHVLAVKPEQIPKLPGSSHRSRTVRDDAPEMASFSGASKKAMAEQLWGDFETINKELADYHPNLVKKPQVVVVNKMDLLPEDVRGNFKLATSKLFKKKGVEKVLFVSAATKFGLEDLTKVLLKGFGDNYEAVEEGG